MNINEYNKIKEMDYESYCGYLQNKYGLAKRPYFTENYSKIKTNVRSKEGLIIHHKKEDVAIMLSNPSFARENPFEYQLPENLVYCDYLEHLLLHVLICEDIIVNRKKIRNENELVGVGGAVNFICPELNDVYSGYKSSQEWKQVCHAKVIEDRDVYFIDKRFFRGVSLIGTMEVLETAEAKERIWQDGDTMYYKEGVADPDYCVLKFTAVKGRYYSNFKSEDFEV